jgi:hypothetical protein
MSKAREFIAEVNKLDDKNVQEFIKYVWDFYGPDGIHRDFFDGKLKISQVNKAVKTLLSNKKHEFVGDSTDRELVRDIMLHRSGKLNAYFP